MTKRLLALLLGGMILALPTAGLAATFQEGETQTIPANQVIDDDLYIAGENVTLNGTVNGDVFVAGGMVTVAGTVNGDVNAAGGQVEIKGTVTDDLRVAGGQVEVSGTIGDDLFLAGGEVMLDDTGKVAGGTYIGAGQATISGDTQSITAGVGMLKLLSTANVNGDLTYWSDESANIADGAVVSGITRQNATGKKDVGAVVDDVFGSIIIGAIISAVMAALFASFFPNKVTAIMDDTREHWGINLLWGFLFLIALPILATIALVTIVGVPIGIGLFLLYPVMLYLAHLVAAIWLGHLILVRGDRTQPMWLIALVGVIAITILKLIPVVGWILTAAIFLIGLGGLVRFDWNLLGKLRSDNKI